MPVIFHKDGEILIRHPKEEQNFFSEEPSAIVDENMPNCARQDGNENQNMDIYSMDILSNEDQTLPYNSK